MLGNAAAAVFKHVHDWAGRLVAATKSSQTPLRWLLGSLRLSGSSNAPQTV